jgi:transposase-like protein
MSKLRKRYTKEQKLEIVNQSLEEDVIIEELGKRYDIHPNSIYKWRRDLSVFEENVFPGNGNKLMTDVEKEKYKLQQRIK